MKLSPFHKTRPHPRAGSQPLSGKKGSAGIVKFKVDPHCPPIPGPLPVLHDIQGLKGPGLPDSPPALPATQARTLGPRGPVRPVPSWRSSAPTPTDRRASPALKAAAPVWAAEGALEAAIPRTTVPRPSLSFG